MHLDRQAIAIETVREIKRRSLPDIVRIVVGEDVQPEQAGRRLEAVDAVCREGGPYRHLKKLVGGERRLDALGDPEFLVWLVQPDGSAVDGADRRQCLFAGI